VALAAARISAQAAVRAWWATADGAAYRAECEAFNAAITARKAARTGERQARANAASTAVVRNAACTRCFASHAGEC
jgi:hypothetical protein